MQITIKQCLKALPPYNGTNKQGKPYTIFQRPCILSDDTVSEVKAMSQELFDTIADGATLDVEEKEWQGKKSYMVNKPGQSGGGWKGKQWTPPAKIPWVVYVKLCRNIYAEAKKIDAANVVPLFDRMLSNASVMLDIKALTEQKQPVEQAKESPKPTPASKEEVDAFTGGIKSDASPFDPSDDDSIF